MTWCGLLFSLCKLRSFFSTLFAPLSSAHLRSGAHGPRLDHPLPGRLELAQDVVDAVEELAGVELLAVGRGLVLAGEALALVDAAEAQLEPAARDDPELALVEARALVHGRHRAVGDVVELARAAREEATQGVDEAARRPPGAQGVAGGARAGWQGQRGVALDPVPARRERGAFFVLEMA